MAQRGQHSMVCGSKVFHHAGKTKEHTETKLRYMKHLMAYKEKCSQDVIFSEYFHDIVYFGLDTGRLCPRAKTTFSFFFHLTISRILETGLC